MGAGVIGAWNTPASDSLTTRGGFSYGNGSLERVGAKKTARIRSPRVPKEAERARKELTIYLPTTYVAAHFRQRAAPVSHPLT